MHRWSRSGAAALGAAVCALAGCGSSGDASGFDIDAGTGQGDDGGGGGQGTFGSGGEGGSLGGGSSSCPSGGKTTVSGTVYDPAGKNPLYDVVVFVPSVTPPPIPEGVSCDQCSATVSHAITDAITGPDGKFVLDDVPAGANVPLVLQVGKWRRQITLPNVTACADNPIDDPNLLRLPRNQAEGNMPRMAIATGSIDPFECLLRKIGIDDAEFTAPTGTGRVHMYQENGSVLASGAVPASQLESDLKTLEKYDLVIFPCEATPQVKDAAAVKNVVDYTSAGGRVFATHYSYTWLNGGAPFDATATFAPNQPPFVDPNATVDTSFPKGVAFSQWLSNVQASTTPGKLELQQVRFDVTGVGSGSQRWVSTTPTISLGGASQSIQHYTFNTPIGADPAQQCGRVVYSDFHVVTAASLPGAKFPQPVCGTDLTMLPQEKALEFMLFDLSSCIQSDGLPPQPPPK